MSDYVAINQRASAATRMEAAQDLPFFLRAWWLRDRIEFQNIGLGEGGVLTQPAYTMHSDPLCDASNCDIYTA